MIKNKLGQIPSEGETSTDIKCYQLVNEMNPANEYAREIVSTSCFPFQAKAYNSWQFAAEHKNMTMEGLIPTCIIRSTGLQLTIRIMASNRPQADKSGRR